MLYESAHVRVEANDGIATLWLAFPGAPVNALTPPRLADVERGLDAVATNPHVEILVVRSGLPGGFCGGHDPEWLADLIGDDGAQTAFAQAGQRVLARLADLDAVTVAYVEGPCVGPGLELAMACDYRLAVAGPDSRVGWGTVPPCWWGVEAQAHRPRSVGLQPAHFLTAREAVRAKLFDDAFCERRGKIELRTFLDRLQASPRKPRRPRAADPATARVRFRAALRDPAVIAAVTAARWLHDLPDTPLPEVVGFVGGDATTVTLAVDVALRGHRAVVSDSGPSSADAAVARALADAVRRGRVTPLEADTARKRITVDADVTALRAAGWVVSPTVGAPLAFLEPHLLPRAVVTVPPESLPLLTRHAGRPDRFVAVAFDGGRAALADGPTASVVAAWLMRLGVAVRFGEPTALPAARVAA